LFRSIHKRLIYPRIEIIKSTKVSLKIKVNDI
jgi:hypothetical protein